MKKILSLILICLAPSLFAQEVQIDTFKLKKSERFKDMHSEALYFPIIKTGNSEVDALINSDLKSSFTYNEYPNTSLDSTLTQWFDEQIVYLNFQVTYNNNGILSLNISAEGCGAYCTGWTEYFNYSTKSGKAIGISEFIDTTGAFKTMVFADKQAQYNQQKQELKDMLKDPESDLDQTTYEWVLEYYEDCESSFNLEAYAIHPNHLDIIAPCSLPNAIKHLTPNISLKYSDKDIGNYLKLKN